MAGPTHRSLETIVRRSALLIAMYGVAAVISLWISRTLPDFDYGLHLRTGQWTVEHGWVPDAEVFSAHSSTPRWVAYSWAYEVLLYGLDAALGVWAQIALAVAMSLAIAHVLFTMVRRISGRTALAAGLSLIGIVAIAPMLYGRSMMFTIVLATLELHLLLRATALDERRALLFVPLVFAVWANLHVHFLYGLFLYGCFLLQAWLDALRSARASRAAVDAWSLATQMTWIGVACVLATLVNPYHVRIYDPIVRYLFQAPMIYTQLQELKPPSLSSIPSWMTLALIFLVVVGAGRRLLGRPFLLLMFAIAVAVGLRSARDAWFIVVTGSALLAAALRGPREERLMAQPLVVAAGTACAIAVAVSGMGITADSLRAHLRERFPVDATAFIESENLSWPIYNDYNWGGYLMWRFPDRKVSIDGRTYVHETGYILHSLQTWGAEPGWENDPELLTAGFVLGSQQMPLTASLKRDPRFRLAYEDGTSAVFVRNR
jgi:hypothetical protein